MRRTTMVRPSARCRRNSSRCGEMSLHRGRAVSTTACKREREREREIVPDIENQTAAETSSPRGECSLQKFPFCHVSRATRGVTNVTRERLRAFCTLIHGYSRLRVSSIKFFFWAAARRRLAIGGAGVLLHVLLLLGCTLGSSRSRFLLVPRRKNT